MGLRCRLTALCATCVDRLIVPMGSRPPQRPLRSRATDVTPSRPRRTALRATDLSCRIRRSSSASTRGSAGTIRDCARAVMRRRVLQQDATVTPISMSTARIQSGSPGTVPSSISWVVADVTVTTRVSAPYVTRPRRSDRNDKVVENAARLEA